MDDNKATLVIEEIEDKITIPISEYYQLVRAEAVLDMVKGLFGVADELTNAYSKGSILDQVMKVADNVLTPCVCCEACKEPEDEKKDEDDD